MTVATTQSVFVTKAEAARLLDVSWSALDSLIARGLLVEARSIPGVRARWRRADVLALRERYTAPIPKTK